MATGDTKFVEKWSDSYITAIPNTILGSIKMPGKCNIKIIKAQF